MRIAIVANPGAGRGDGAAAQSRLVEALRAAGHDAWPIAVNAGEDRPLADAAQQANLIVLVGGDGTVHRALPHLADSRAAIWHHPAGTENLFARETGCTASIPDLLAALREPAYANVDLGVLITTGEPRPFALMWSLGPDAGVIHRMHARRRGPISRLSYAAPILYEFNDPTLPELTVRVDGTPLATSQRGMVVVANARAYALQINPAPLADLSDGRLDVAFIPATSARAALSELLAAKAGRPGSRLHAKGVRVEIDLASHAPTQLDGEAGPVVSGRVRLGVRPASLRVLRRA